jgi:hypothetical protein
VAVIGSVVVFGGIVDAAPGMVNQMVGQFLGDGGRLHDRMYYRDPEAARIYFSNLIELSLINQ